MARKPEVTDKNVIQAEVVLETFGKHLIRAQCARSYGKKRIT